jgi:hypothetical protein
MIRRLLLALLLILANSQAYASANGILTQGMSSSTTGGGGGGSTSLSALTSATGANTISNGGFAQEWDSTALIVTGTGSTTPLKVTNTGNQALIVTGNSALNGTTTVTNLNVTGTCSGCGAAFTPVLQPLSVTTTDTAGNEFPYTYFDSTTTGAAAIGAPAWGTAASLSADTSLRFRFMMPPALPASGTLNLCTVCQANATSGVVKYTVSDADIATNNTASVGATALDSETQTSITWSAVDNYVTTCTPLTESPAANHISAGAVTFNHTSWTLGQILSCNLIERWQ